MKQYNRFRLALALAELKGVFGRIVFGQLDFPLSVDGEIRLTMTLYDFWCGKH